MRGLHCFYRASCGFYVVSFGFWFVSVAPDSADKSHTSGPTSVALAVLSRSNVTPPPMACWHQMSSLKACESSANIFSVLQHRLPSGWGRAGIISRSFWKDMHIIFDDLAFSFFSPTRLALGFLQFGREIGSGYSSARFPRRRGTGSPSSRAQFPQHRTSTPSL